MALFLFRDLRNRAIDRYEILRGRTPATYGAYLEAAESGDPEAKNMFRPASTATRVAATYGEYLEAEARQDPVAKKMVCYKPPANGLHRACSAAGYSGPK